MAQDVVRGSATTAGDNEMTERRAIGSAAVWPNRAARITSHGNR